VCAVRVERRARLGAQRHDAILAPFAVAYAHVGARAVDLDVADVQTTRFGHAQPGAVDDLEQRALERELRGVGVGTGTVAVEQAADVFLAQERGQAPRSLGRAQRGDRAARRQAAPHGEAKERAQRRQLSTDGHGVVRSMERRKVGAAHADVKHRERRGAPQRRARVADQLTHVVKVRADRMGGSPLLRGQVLAEGSDGFIHGRRIVAQADGGCESETGTRRAQPGFAGRSSSREVRNPLRVPTSIAE